MILPLSTCSERQPTSSEQKNPLPKPQRIVSLAPSITESIAFLGLTEKLVAVTRFCDYPPEVTTLPKVGGYIDPSLEAIVRAAPDLVLGLSEHQETLNKLKRANIPCLALDERSLEGIFKSLILLGKVCGKPEHARQKVAALRAKLTAARARVRGRGTPTVLVSVGRHAGEGAVGKVYAAGPKTFLGQLLEIAGGKNLASGMNAAFPPLSTEGLLRLNPQVLFDVVPGITKQGISKKMILSDWKKLPLLQAVRERRIYILSANWAVRPSPRFPKILDAFIRGLHPKLSQPKLQTQEKK
jgi:iron complex transport system substrate-binding protein